jgi:hypothetical protein
VVKPETLKVKLDEDVVNRCLFVKGYIREAWKLAKAKCKGQDEQYKKRKPFVSLSKETQALIELLSKKLLLSTSFNANNPVPFAEHWTPKDIRVFFKKNKGINKILQDRLLLDDLERNKQRAIKLIARFSNPLKIVADLCRATSYHFPIPPVNLILGTIQGALTFLSNAMRHRAMQYDPDLKVFSSVQRYSVYVSGLGSTTVVGLIMSAVASGPLIVPIAAFLTAIGSLSVSISNLMQLWGSIISLANEIKKRKDPKETYNWRVFKKATSYVKYATHSAFYLCVSTLAVAAVVALFANPVGLAVLAASMFTMALVAVGVSVGTLILKKLANHRIKSITKAHLEKGTDKKLHASPILGNKSKRTIERAATLGHRRHITHSSTASVMGPGFALMRKTLNDRKRICASGRSLSLQDYQQLSLIALKELAQKKKHDPIYQGVKYSIEKQKDKEKDQESDKLVIQVPKQNAEGAKLEKIYDKIERYRNKKKAVELQLTYHPSDKALFVLFDMNRVLAPLKMERCSDPITMLRVFEAAKLMNVEVILDSKDRALLMESKNPKLSAYFTMIEHWSREAFQAYINSAAKGQRKLGEIPATLPLALTAHKEIRL